MKNQAGSSRLDTILKMLLIAFISLLAFSSGVFFGKQMSDSDYQLKALEGDFKHGEKSAEHKDQKNEHGEEGLADDEVASLTDKYVNAEKEKDGAANEEESHAAPGGNESRKVASADRDEKAGEGSHGAAQPAHGTQAAHGVAAAPAAHEETKAAPRGSNAKPDLSAAHAAATRVANNRAPSEPTAKKEVETNRVPSSLPKTIGASNDIEFTVQVASYPTAEAAKEHANALVKKGFPAFPVEANVGGRTWYRVSVGSFKTMKDATTYRAQILKQADVQSAIVQRIQR
jgi:cell division protein FtsN